MSYAGREVLLCADGHVMIISSLTVMNDGWRSVPRCPAIVHSNQKCHKEWRWRYSIDDTNGQGPMPELKIVAKENVHKCRCGNTHLIESARYEPEKDGSEHNGWKERWVVAE